MMKKIILLIFIFSIISCLSSPLKQSDKEAVQKKKIFVKVGEDLEPYVGKEIHIIAEVSNTKFPSLGNYWITIFELEDYRAKKIHVWGIVYKKKESSEGGYVQGRDGTYYHLEVKGIDAIE